MTLHAAVRTWEASVAGEAVPLWRHAFFNATAAGSWRVASMAGGCQSGEAGWSQGGLWACLTAPAGILLRACRKMAWQISLTSQEQLP